MASASNYKGLDPSAIPSELKIGFIGAGVMAKALAKGFINSGLIKADNIVMSDTYPGMLEGAKALGVSTTMSNQEIVNRSQVVILAVKPNCVRPVLKDISTVVSNDVVIVSIAAGIKLETIEELLAPGTRVVRVMPNTPCLVQEGAAVVAPGTSAKPHDAELITHLMRSVGTCDQGSEKLLDAVTGLSGSGPAYVFAAIEAMADGGVLMGLPRDLSLKLAAQTMLGAAKMVLESGRHPGELKDQVCSPGGTTITAIHSLEKNGFRGCLIDAVQAATIKAQELSKDS